MAIPMANRPSLGELISNAMMHRTSVARDFLVETLNRASRGRFSLKPHQKDDIEALLMLIRVHGDRRYPEATEADVRRCGVHSV